MGDRIDLALIREHHAIAEGGNWLGTGNARHIHEQRGQLLAEVDRLTAENDVLRTEIANITANKREQP